MNGLPAPSRKVLMSFDDSPSIDAFGRLRTGEPTKLIELKRVGNAPDNFATTLVSGSGASIYTTNHASTALTVGPGVGVAVRQSKARAIYQAGKSLQILQTCTMAPTQTNLRQRMGYFDDKNGVFVEQHGTAIRMVIRSYRTGTAVDNQALQSNWNVDKLDGTGKSGLTLDLTKAEIFEPDLEYLGVGRVRVGFVINGLPVVVHEFNHANINSGVYMSNPNLPLRWEIEALGAVTGAPSIEAICGVVNSEGGYEINGVTSGGDSGDVGNAIAAGATEEVMSVRMQGAFTEFATAFINRISIINTTSGPFRWRLVLNPTETGAGTWVQANSSIMEYNRTRTVTAGTGFVLDNGLISAQQNSVDIDSKPVLTMGTTLAGVTDVISLQITNLSNQSEDFYGALTWREVI